MAPGCVVKKKRKAIRLREYDYSSAGYYFVTVCVQQLRRGGSRTGHRDNMFGHIANKKMILNDIEKIVDASWQWLTQQYIYVQLDDYILMPDHLHGIICIRDIDDNNGMTTGGSRTAPTGQVKRESLGRIIGSFKTVSTKRINILRHTSGSIIWQRSFFDHVIRTERSLNNIRKYIRNNPINWQYDEYNTNGAL